MFMLMRSTNAKMIVIILRCLETNSVLSVFLFVKKTWARELVFYRQCFVSTSKGKVVTAQREFG